MSRLGTLHPFLFAFFPVLFVFSQNVDELLYMDLLRLTFIIEGATAGAMWLGKIVYGTWRKAAIVVSIGLCLFFSYGHLYTFGAGAAVWGLPLARHHIMLPIWTASFLIGAYGVFFIEREMKEVTGFLNVASSAMVVMSLATVGFYEVQTLAPTKKPQGQISKAASQGKSVRSPQPSSESEERPNVYYVVLDGYASSSTLRHVFNYENSQFERFLEKRGFYVARRSRSNYSLSFLSLASSLNMRYLDSLSNRLGPTATSQAPAYDLIKNSSFARQLRSNSYQFVHFNSGYKMSGKNRFADINIACTSSSRLQYVLLRTTLLRPFEDDLSGVLFRHPYTTKRKRLRCTFEELRNLTARSEEPFFAFAHIVAPHGPFVFGPDGELMKEAYEQPDDHERWKRKGLYLGQLQYVNRQVRRLVGSILERSQVPPVIIFQADHGPAATGDWLHETPNGAQSPRLSNKLIRERSGILNAYHFPGNCADSLYPSISPVNSFRLVSNCYFEAELPLLNDRSYFSTYRRPYKFREVTQTAHWKDQ